MSYKFGALVIRRQLRVLTDFRDVTENQHAALFVIEPDVIREEGV
jgi:hypothetical protein